MKLEDFFNHNIGIEEYITGNRFIDICQESNVTFCKSDFLDEHPEAQHNVLVTHNSDYHIDASRAEKGPKNLKVWFAQNKDLDNEILKAIPIGLENMILRINMASKLGRYSSQPINGLAKAVYINDLSQKTMLHDNLVYLNMNASTFLSERGRVLNLFKNESWATYKKGLSWKEYYEDVASHKFILSPRGNGVDCHRTWEALYLRTIPIVRESTCMNDFRDLPILFVKNWEEISYNYLNEKYKEMTSKTYDLSKMKLSYWKRRINNAKT